MLAGEGRRVKGVTSGGMYHTLCDNVVSLCRHDADYFIDVIVWPPGDTTLSEASVLAVLVHEEAHPVVPNPR